MSDHNGRSETDAGELIAMREVIKTYQSEAGIFHALRGIDLDVGRSEFVSIVGKSGSGKSTLINMIAGIDRPTSGTVRIDGTPVHLLSENKLAIWRGKTLGIVFQFFQLLPTLNVLENVMLPMDFCGTYGVRERPGRAMDLLTLVGLEDQANKLPSAMSGGQQQRAAIARALANDPPILLADEPTGNLDSVTGDAVIELFHALVDAGKTILIVTHDADLASSGTRTIVLADGSIVEQRRNDRGRNPVAVSSAAI